MNRCHMSREELYDTPVIVLYYLYDHSLYDIAREYYFAQLRLF
jgi:hypothetical protein